MFFKVLHYLSLIVGLKNLSLRPLKSTLAKSKLMEAQIFME